jgi:hypothetical protein
VRFRAVIVTAAGDVLPRILKCLERPGSFVLLIWKGGPDMKLDLPGETAEYRAARNDLLDHEIALRRQMEAVAAARRALPPGGLIREDYAFDAIDPDGRPRKVKLSELFLEGKDSLVVYNMMFRATGTILARRRKAVLPPTFRARKVRARRASPSWISSTARPGTSSRR